MPEHTVPPVPQSVPGSGQTSVPVSVPDHEFEELEVDSSVPPRPEEEIADARADSDSA